MNPEETRIKNTAEKMDEVIPALALNRDPEFIGGRRVICNLAKSI